MSKKEIRLNSQYLGLADSERPANPCLASRLLYGTAVTALNLNIVESMENTLQRLGFIACRARFDGTTLRIEVPASDIERIVLSENREILIKAAQTAGAKFITLDLEGFSSGKLNRMVENHA
jgi:uncharacterized protein